MKRAASVSDVLRDHKHFASRDKRLLSNGVAAGGLDAGENDRDSCFVHSLFQRKQGAQKPPGTNAAPSDEADAQIVRELNEMSLKDRETLFEEIHGVLYEMKENGDFIQQKLAEMQSALRWIRNKPAYDQAYFLSPSFVRDRTLRLLMLRSTNYDPNRAAHRLVNHLEFKLKLFGLSKLVLPEITQDDLTLEMKRNLDDAHHQILPQKDRAGRTIIFMAPRERVPDQDWKSHFGMLWYVFMTALRDEDTQKKGIVYIMYNLGVSKAHGQFNRSVIPHAAAFEAACPSKMAVLHFLYNNPTFRPVLSVIQMALSKNMRLRMRSHYGSHMECIYQLMSFGITAEMLPVDSNGHLDVEFGQKQLEKFRELERERTRVYEITAPIVPRPQDCVLGRGYPFQRFPGNIFMSHVIELNRERYPTLRRDPKTSMTMGIVKYIQTVHGGRFLKRATEDYKCPEADAIPEGECWVEVDDEQARRKVGHGFRAPRRKDQASSEIQTERFDLGKDDDYIMVPVSEPRNEEVLSYEGPQNLN